MGGGDGEAGDGGDDFFPVGVVGDFDHGAGGGLSGGEDVEAVGEFVHFGEFELGEAADVGGFAFDEVEVGFGVLW
ncbi:hypothetical protein O1L60_00570 [Streptomyces diastatochromogenes]|nr:hypothetical protein [Streptomyces diastatochromogenes]